MKNKQIYITTNTHPFLRENIELYEEHGDLYDLNSDIKVANAKENIRLGWVVERQEPEFTADDVIKLANQAYQEHFHSSEYDTYDQCIKDIVSKARKK